MLNLFTQFGAESSGISALGVNGKQFIIQLITFVIVILVLRKFAIKPILKVLQQRRETIEQGVSLGEKMKKDEAELEKQVAKALAEARTEADKIIADASDRGREVIAEAEEKAKQKAEGIIASAEDRIRQDTVRARRQLEGELSTLIAEATEAVVDEKVDAKKDAVLIDRALKGAAK